MRYALIDGDGNVLNTIMHDEVITQWNGYEAILAPDDVWVSSLVSVYDRKAKKFSAPIIDAEIVKDDPKGKT